MEQIWEDLDSGEIHLRDRWQFELKSEFVPLPHLKKNTYIQEFFFFIPNSLQINKQTYGKANFYSDQTNLIRYKTPEFTFQELISTYNPHSPLSRLQTLSKEMETKDNREHAEDEIKLFGNIARSTLRTRVREIIQELSQTYSQDDAGKFIKEIEELCKEIKDLKHAFLITKDTLLKNWKDSYLQKSFLYVEEFISNCIMHYLTGLLDAIRLVQKKTFYPADRMLCEILLEEQKFLEAYVNDSQTIGKQRNVNNEFILYRNGLLNKYVLDALLLYTNRFSIDERFQNWIGGLSAGIAMMFYFLLFVWLGSVFVINSAPFIILTVVFYILKDRIKEWLKSVSYQQAFKFFYDYITEIDSPDQKRKLGIIKESFSFLDENKLAEDVKNARNKEFHAILETLDGPTQIRANVLEFLGAKHHDNDQQNDQPVPNRKRTHDELL